MATMEEIKLAMDTVQNLEGLRKDMLNNASQYTDKSIEIMKADAVQYLRRIKWQEDIMEGVKLLSGLSAIGLSKQEIVDTCAELKAVARGVDKETDPQKIIDAALTIAPHKTVWT